MVYYRSSYKALSLVFLLLISANSASAGIFDGWTSHMQDLESLPHEKSYVFVITLPSRTPISYATPGDLKNSLIYNNNQSPETPAEFDPVDRLNKPEEDKVRFLKSPSSVGHTMIAWRCSYQGVHYKGMTAYGGESSQQVQKMIDRGFGLSGLFATYTDGYFFKPFPQEGEVDSFGKAFYQANIKTNPDDHLDMKWVGQEVTANDCIQAVQFANNFLIAGQQRGQDAGLDHGIFNFGFNFDPESFEGAGCSSFARSFLDSANVFNFVSNHWERKLRIPPNLLGHPGDELLPVNTQLDRRPRYYSQRRRNPDFTEILNTERTKLGLLFKPWRAPESDEPGYNLDLVDVELIHFTIGEVERLVNEKTDLRLSGFVLEPRQEIRYGEQTLENIPVDRQLDEHTREISRSLLQNLNFSSRNFEVREINGVKGLIIKK